jgi:glycosyltransferase involved in cell wall biosynthesis
MNIIATAEMGPGTFEAKFVPLSKSNYIKQIWVIRKTAGPEIDKVQYIIVPKLFHGKILGLLARPLMLVWYTIKLRANVILAYHFIPHAFFAYFASIITGKPYIICQTGLYIQRYFQKNKFSSWLVKKVISSALFLNVPGNRSLEFWVSNGVPKSKVNVLHSTIDTNFFKPDPNINKEYDFIILSRLAKEKRVDIIIELLSQLKNKGYKFKAVIVGDGPEMSSLRKQVERENLNDFIEFVGFQKDTNKWFNLAKYYLMYSESEGLPTSLMQAMSCGLIPVVTNVGNISDLVNEKTGFLQNFDNPIGFLKTLEFLLSSQDKTLLQNYSLECRNIIIKEHSYESAQKKWESILEKIN